MYVNAENIKPGDLADVDYVGYRRVLYTLVHLHMPTVVEVWHEGAGRENGFPQMYRCDERVRTLPGSGNTFRVIGH